MADNITKKYRPKTFSSVIGQHIAVKTLQGAIGSGKMPPAYLFYGIQGSGKTTLARLIAMSLNCTNRTGVEPCGSCPNCTDIQNDCSDWLTECDGATNSGVADIRDLMGSVRFMVPDGSYRVLIIDECHALSKQAWQAALKTIEEPPSNVMFIFCTTEIQKVIATIKSRCVKLQFLAVDDSLIITMLKSILVAEKVEFEEKALTGIAKYSNGSIRDAQSILEGFLRTGKVSAKEVSQIYQTLDPMSVINFFNYISQGNTRAAAQNAHNWLKLGTAPELIITALMEHLRNMIMDFTIEDETIRALAINQRKILGDEKISSWIEFLYEQMNFLRNYPMSHWLLLDLITIRFISTAKQNDLEDIEKRKTKTATTRASNKSIEKQTSVVEDSANAVDEVPLSSQLIGQLERACGGRTISLNRTRTQVTIQNGAGTHFDVVTRDELAVNPVYILATDLPAAIQGYPAIMEQIIKHKITT